jgi:hypothetical protein
MEPYVVAMQFLGDRADIHELLFHAFVRTRRKVCLDDVKLWQKNSGVSSIPLSGHSVVEDKWCYYKQSEWPSALFIASVRKEFKALTVSDFSRAGSSYSECKAWEQSFHSFLRANPETVQVYLSANPSSTLRDMFPSELGIREVADPLAGIYKCPTCNLAFIESQLRAGITKRCSRCGSIVEPYLKGDGKDSVNRSFSKRRFKASRFLGSDPWLKSLFD